MDEQKRKKLEAAGWRLGDAEEFLDAVTSPGSDVVPDLFASSLPACVSPVHMENLVRMNNPLILYDRPKVESEYDAASNSFRSVVSIPFQVTEVTELTQELVDEVLRQIEERETHEQS